MSDQNPANADEPWGSPPYSPSPRDQGGGYGPPYQAPYSYTGGYGPQRPAGTNGKAIAALILGIIGLVGCQLVSIAAVVVGSIARRETSQTGQAGYGFALSGLILGWVGVAILVFVCVMFVLGVSVFGLGSMG